MASENSRSKKRKRFETDNDNNENIGDSSSNNFEILSNTSLECFKTILSESIISALKDMGFSTFTQIQERCIPHLLKGKDLVGSAKTGSGKTLAFLIPAVELISRINLAAVEGVSVIILSPTRELAIQIYDVLQNLLKYNTECTHALIIGGNKFKKEAKILSSGINIVVATPGRLLDHLLKTTKFIYKNLRCLIIDEADKLLNFEDHFKQVIALLPKKRQTILFSATQNSSTEMIAKAMMQTPLYIGIDDSNETATVSGLNQQYIVCSPERRTYILWLLLYSSRKEKVIVFFGSCKSVDFYHLFFKQFNFAVKSIHGKRKQQTRTNTMREFFEATSGILLCTDVAARGLDIPAIDFVIQFDPPSDPKEYIHRVGRTARGEGGRGRSLLFLREEEQNFLYYLRINKVNPVEIKTTEKINGSLTCKTVLDLISNNETLKSYAKDAFKAYLKSYIAHHLKDVFDVNNLDLRKLALSYGLSEIPLVELHVSLKKKKKDCT